MACRKVPIQVQPVRHRCMQIGAHANESDAAKQMNKKNWAKQTSVTRHTKRRRHRANSKTGSLAYQGHRLDTKAASEAHRRLMQGLSRTLYGLSLCAAPRPARQPAHPPDRIASVGRDGTTTKANEKKRTTRNGPLDSETQTVAPPGRGPRRRRGGPHGNAAPLDEKEKAENVINHNNNNTRSRRQRLRLASLHVTVFVVVVVVARFSSGQGPRS